MPSLFEIETEYLRLVELLTVGPDEMPDDVAREFEARFAEWESDAEAKADAYVAVIRRLELNAASLKAQKDQYQAEADRFKERAATEANAAARMKERLKDFLTMTGRTNLVTAEGRIISVQKNGGKPPLLVPVLPDLDALPPELVIVDRSLNLDAIREKLKAGQVFDWASIGDAGTHLRIR